MEGLFERVRLDVEKRVFDGVGHGFFPVTKPHFGWADEKGVRQVAGGERRVGCSEADN